MGTHLRQLGCSCACKEGQTGRARVNACRQAHKELGAVDDPGLKLHWNMKFPLHLVNDDYEDVVPTAILSTTLNKMIHGVWRSRGNTWT
jgi:hypothetical protein